MCYCYHVGLWHVLAVITRPPSNERVASVFCRAEVASILSGSLRGVLHCQKIDHARLSSRTSSPRGRRRCRSCSPPSAPTGCKLQLQRSTCSGRWFKPSPASEPSAATPALLIHVAIVSSARGDSLATSCGSYSPHASPSPEMVRLNSANQVWTTWPYLFLTRECQFWVQLAPLSP